MKNQPDEEDVNGEKEPEIIIEWGASIHEQLERVCHGRSYRLQVCDPEKGAARIMREGELCRQTPRTRENNFHMRRTEPVPMPTIFEVIRPHRTIGEDGLYINLVPGDIIEIAEKENALELWKRHIIRPSGMTINKEVDNEQS